jgi:hypothetical protein
LEAEGLVAWLKVPVWIIGTGSDKEGRGFLLCRRRITDDRGRRTDDRRKKGSLAELSEIAEFLT